MTAHQDAVDRARKMIIVRSSRHKPGSDGDYLAEADRRRPMNRAEFQREAERLLIEALKAGTYIPAKNHRAIARRIGRDQPRSLDIDERVLDDDRAL